MKIIRKGEKESKLKDIIELVISNGGIEYSLEAAHNYSEKAKLCLDVFEDTDYKKSLLSLVDYVIERDK